MTKIPLTPVRVQRALEALRRDLARVLEQADRRLAGPRLDTAKPVLVEQAVNASSCRSSRPRIGNPRPGSAASRALTL